VVEARLEVHGSGVWPGRHSHTVPADAWSGRVAAPVPGTNAVSTPAPMATARDAVLSVRATRFLMSGPA
jgi:hypothetical protein